MRNPQSPMRSVTQP